MPPPPELNRTEVLIYPVVSRWRVSSRISGLKALIKSSSRMRALHRPDQTDDRRELADPDAAGQRRTVAHTRIAGDGGDVQLVEKRIC